MALRTGVFLLAIFSLMESPLSAQHGTFHLYQVNRPRTRSAVNYEVAGSYTVGKDGVVVVRIAEMMVFASGSVTLHTLKIGLCSETDGFAVPGDEVFAPEIPLEKTLETNQKYTMPVRTVRIVLTKKVPKHNYFCTVLSNSGGNDYYAQGSRMTTVVLASEWIK